MRFVPLLSTLLLFTTPHSGSSQTVYDVVPVDLGDGYRIVGGTITVTGTAITAWNIPVAGDLPYTFSEASPGASFSQTREGVNITPDKIVFPAAQSGSQVVFLAGDNSLPACSSCQQALVWSSLSHLPNDSFPLVRYVWSDTTPPFPDGFAEKRLDLGELVVATVVPEPTSSLLLVLGVLGLMGARQKRRRR